MDRQDEKTYEQITQELTDEPDALAEELLHVEKKNGKIRKLGMKKTIVLLSIAVVLIAAVLVVTLVAFPKKEETDDQVITLYEYDQADLVSMEIDNKTVHSQYTLTSFMNGTQLEWNIEGQRYSDVNQTRTGYLARFGAKLSTQNVIACEESRLDEYGLKNSAVTVIFSYKDGTRHTVDIGKTYGSSEGAYVLLDGQTDKVYIVSTYIEEYFTQPLSWLLNLPSLSRTSLSSQSLYLLSAKRELIQLSYIPGPLSGAEAWYMLEPTISETVSDKVDEVFSGISDLTLNAYFCERAGEDLSLYGFQKPTLELQSYDAEGKLLDQFVVGSLIDDSQDEYYCALITEGETFETSPVYTVKASMLAPLQVTAVDIANPYLVALNVYWLRHGTFLINGETYELTVDRTVLYDDQGKELIDTDGSVKTSNLYYINGKLLDDLQFKSFYSKVLFLSIEGLVPDDTPKGEVLFSYSLDVVIPVTDYETGAFYEKEAVYEGTYYRISDTYAVFKNNESDKAVFTVRCRSVDAVAEAMQLLLEGRMPTA
ncbi:MAG: DUF4340 domain-containing protein [Clostridia bacterium]|nr:DUF4340 domain-containing protein [Clostridia bacterium]